MKSDEFARLVRDGNDKLRVDRIVLVDPKGGYKFTGKGMLRISGESLEIDFTGRGRGWPPSRQTNVVTEKDYWKLAGVINDHLHFFCDLVNPDGPYQSLNRVVTFTRTLHSIELVIRRPDPAKSRRARNARYRRLGVTIPARHRPSNADRALSFEATLVDCELPGANASSETVRKNDFLPTRSSSAGDTLLGEITGGRYALIRANNRRDLEMHLRSEPGSESESYEEDHRKCQAWLQAVAFVTGVQPWPYRMKYSRGTYLMSDTIRAAERPPRTIYSALSRGFGHEHAAELGAAIKAATDFLEPDTPFNRKLVHLLFLFRQAGADGVQLEITTLTICVLLERLVRLIFKAECRQNSGGAHSELGTGNIEDVFKAICQKLNIPWQQEVGPIFTEWKRVRNTSAHGKFHHDVAVGFEQEEAERAFFGISRIAGGFNMILLKLFGYSGRYLSSATESTHRVIKQ